MIKMQITNNIEMMFSLDLRIPVEGLKLTFLNPSFIITTKRCRLRKKKKFIGRMKRTLLMHINRLVDHLSGSQVKNLMPSTIKLIRRCKN